MCRKRDSNGQVFQIIRIQKGKMESGWIDCINHIINNNVGRAVVHDRHTACSLDASTQGVCFLRIEIVQVNFRKPNFALQCSLIRHQRTAIYVFGGSLKRKNCGFQLIGGVNP
jgi:hypothetical protein